MIPHAWAHVVMIPHEWARVVMIPHKWDNVVPHPSHVVIIPHSIQVLACLIGLVRNGQVINSSDSPPPASPRCGLA